MNRKGYMIVKRWLSEKYYWLQKWEAEHLPLKPVRPHVIVLLIAFTLVVATIVNAFVRLVDETKKAIGHPDAMIDC